MTIVAEHYNSVVGVDTHARTHTYAVLETATGRVTGIESFPTSAAGLVRAVAWLGRVAPAPTLVAVEGTGSYGARLHEQLTAEHIAVTEARPPKRTDRRKGKSDPIDAEAAARSVLHVDEQELAQPRRGQIRSALRVLLTARRAMDTRRTADRNALTALVRTIDLGVDARRALTARQVTSITRWRERTGDDIEHTVARAEAIRLAVSVTALARQLRANLKGLRVLAGQLAPDLLDEAGIGPVSAATFLTVWSHAGRFRSEAAFASIGGVAPIPASSGNTTRHRLNRHGDRQLNAALTVVARQRMTIDPATRAYVQRRLDQNKSLRDIRRILKRYIARHIHRTLNRAVMT